MSVVPSMHDDDSPKLSLSKHSKQMSMPNSGSGLQWPYLR